MHKRTSRVISIILAATLSVFCVPAGALAANNDNSNAQSTENVGAAPTVTYTSNIQKKGWEKKWKKNGATSGLAKKKLAISNVAIKVSGADGLGISYRTRIQKSGWEGWKSNGATAGSTAKGRYIEGIKVKLTGAQAANYDVYYRACVSKIGWLGWAKNGAKAGSSSEQLGIEAFKIKIVKKGSDAPGSTKNAYYNHNNASKILKSMNFTKSNRKSLYHGPKLESDQKYIVLHDTQGITSAMNIVNGWEGSGNYVAAHFVVGQDGAVVQCVPLNRIAHHAGYGDTGHNKSFGVPKTSRDDMRGSQPIGSWASDYGMNAYSIGIEMVHYGGRGPYTEAQLDALDKLIAYIDAYYGFKSKITDHKAWRSYNPDMSPEFAKYMKNYKRYRHH